MIINNWLALKNFPQFRDQEKKNVRQKIENWISKRRMSEEAKSTEPYFNAKKKKVIVYWSFLFLALILLSINFSLDIEWKTLWNVVVKSSKKPRFLFTLVFAFSLFFINEVGLQTLSYKCRTKKTLKNIRFRDWATLTIICFFIQSITPFSIGAEPFAIWWLKNKGLDLKEASATIALGATAWFVGQFLITWPSFFIITYQNSDKIFSFTIDKSYWLILLGLIVDICAGIFVALISYSKKIHYKFAKLSNKLKQFFKLEYLTESELKFKYLIDASFQKIYVKKIKSITFIYVVINCLIQNFLIYALFACINGLLNDDYSNFWNEFNIINTSTTSNNFLPTPSGEGSLQITIKKIYGFSKQTANTQNLDFSIFLWRFTFKYIGIIAAIIWIFMFGLNTKQKNSRKTDLMWSAY